MKVCSSRVETQSIQPKLCGRRVHFSMWRKSPKHRWWTDPLLRATKWHASARRFPTLFRSLQKASSVETLAKSITDQPRQKLAPFAAALEKSERLTIWRSLPMSGVFYSAPASAVAGEGWAFSESFLAAKVSRSVTSFVSCARNLILQLNPSTVQLSDDTEKVNTLKASGPWAERIPTGSFGMFGRNSRTVPRGSAAWGFTGGTKSPAERTYVGG